MRRSRPILSCLNRGTRAHSCCCLSVLSLSHVRTNAMRKALLCAPASGLMTRGVTAEESAFLRTYLMMNIPHCVHTRDTRGDCCVFPATPLQNVRCGLPTESYKTMLPIRIAAHAQNPTANTTAGQRRYCWRAPPPPTQQPTNGCCCRPPHVVGAPSKSIT